VIAVFAILSVASSVYVIDDCAWVVTVNVAVAVILAVAQACS
jgi:hypothetical protein